MYFRQKVKYFAIGFLACIFLSTSVFVFAKPIEKQITATYNDIKIYIDDIKVTPRDANGNIVEPFISNGTTYLPLRAIAQALGKSVQWDGKTSSVYIGKHEETGVYLSSLEYARATGKKYFDIWDKNKPFKIAGKEYDKGLGMAVGYDSGKASVVYNLNSTYKRLTGVFGTDDQEKNYATRYTQMTIKGDGNILYKTPNMIPGNHPHEIDVDVAGINQIEFVFSSNSNSSSDGLAVFANAKLYE